MMDGMGWMGWMDGWMDGWMGGWVDGQLWMDSCGWMDVCDDGMRNEKHEK